MNNQSELNKQEGMSLVLDNEEKEDSGWLDRYNALVPTFLREPPQWLENYPLFIGEDVTRFMLENGVGHPHDPNTWGAQFNAKFARSGFLIRTGKTKNAKSGKSNAHAFRQWLSILVTPPNAMVSLNQTLNDLALQVKSRKIDLRQALVLAAQAGAETLT